MYSPFRHAGSIFRKKILHLTFFVTRRCNMRCPFCFYLSGQQSPCVPAEELSLDEIDRFSRSMGDLLWLAFSGGEIFLREDLAEISKVFYRNNRPAIMLYPTNGMMPELIRERTEQILRECGKSIIAVKLSLDGPRETHDELRAMKGSFDKVMTTYHLLEELIGRYPHFELGINTVFCSGNQDTMDEIIDFVRELKQIKTHTISLVRGDISRQDYKNVDRAKYHAAVQKLEKNLKDGRAPMYRFRGARIKAAQDILQRRLIHETTMREKRLIPCYAGRLNLVLTEAGDVYPCETLSDTFGNIRDAHYNMGEVLRSERAGKVIRSILDGMCYCTHECYFMTNILFNPRLYPSLLKEYAQL